jgi:hypothetical protein
MPPPETSAGTPILMRTGKVRSAAVIISCGLPGIRCSSFFRSFFVEECRWTSVLSSPLGVQVVSSIKIVVVSARTDRVTWTRAAGSIYHLTGETRSNDITACFTCPLEPKCRPDKLKRIKRWKHERVLDAMQARLDRLPGAMGVRRQTGEHPFGTFKSWMGSTHFLTRTLKRVRTEMTLHVLAYNMKRVIAIIGVGPLLQAIRA